MAEVYKVARPFERYDEKLKAPRRYRRGDVISMKDAARMSSLGVLLGAGNIYRDARRAGPGGHEPLMCRQLMHHRRGRSRGRLKMGARIT